MLNPPYATTVVDVSARDGLQSFHRWVETDVEVAMIDRLSAAGVPVVEVTNLAHPRVIHHHTRADIMAQARTHGRAHPALIIPIRRFDSLPCRCRGGPTRSSRRFSGSPIYGSRSETA
jgi:hydroxymethylglutaryl-CoA lyase